MCVIFWREQVCRRCMKTLHKTETGRNKCKKALEGRACFCDEYSNCDWVEGPDCPTCGPQLEAEERKRKKQKKEEEEE
ncbi:hypothetical protein CEP51_010209 [Fusarium floridanum]|uniref:Uncharacterized protein n=1 Tax=Fusarium floridanum TaxID=1325733 RepID=A0A428RF82_9HYPO|nr:hypothetical protein CEP51_010209 [Fusarium floridanum]